MGGDIPLERRRQAFESALREMDMLIKPEYKKIAEEIANRFFNECMRGTRDIEDFYIEVLERYGEDVGEQWVLWEIRGWYAGLAFYRPDKWWDMTSIGRVIQANVKGAGQQRSGAEPAKEGAKRCARCGNQVSPTAKFCTKCGARL